MRYTAFLKLAGFYVGGGVLAIAVVLAVTALTPRKWGKLPPSGDCSLTVYVSGGAMHTNLIVPVETTVFNWATHLDLEGVGSKPATDYRYLQFGWGDRIFYMETPSWQEMRITSALRALLLQNPSAMFVKGHATVPRYPGEQLKCVRLGQTDFLALMKFVEASFAVDTQGNKLRLGQGQDGESGFYAANGKYSILKTCNSWTADALRHANVNTPLWGGLAPAVMFHLRNGCECQE